MSKESANKEPLLKPWDLLLFGVVVLLGAIGAGLYNWDKFARNPKGMPAATMAIIGIALIIGVLLTRYALKEYKKNKG